MFITPCEACGKDQWDGPCRSPECAKAVVVITDLKDKLRNAELLASHLQENVLRLLYAWAESPDKPDKTRAVVDFKYIRQLWEAAECRWHEFKDCDSYYDHWNKVWQVLCDAIHLFSVRKSDWRMNTIDCLNRLRDAVEKSRHKDEPDWPIDATIDRVVREVKAS